MTGNILQNVYVKLNRGFCFLLFIIATIWQGEENGKETKDNGTTQGVCCNAEAGSDDVYSNVYNVLQPNYGTERTLPVVDPNNKQQEPKAY